MLEVEHRVGIADRRLEQPVGVRHRARRHDLQARRVLEVRLRVLAVVGRAVDVAARGAADHERHLLPPAVVVGRGEVDDLVEGAGDEVDELHLDDRQHAHHGRADGRAHHGRLADRRVDDPLRPERSRNPAVTRKAPP